jgi:hypothetical protein
MAAPALAPAPPESWPNMVGQAATIDNFNLMLDERPDITVVRVYPMTDNPIPSPDPQGLPRLIIYYQERNENDQRAICWPAPYIMYASNAPGWLAKATFLLFYALIYERQASIE